MGKKVYTSGRTASDVVPVNQKAPKSPDNLVDRLDALTGGNVRTTPLTQIQAALYLLSHCPDEDDARDMAGYLGLTEAFDGIVRVRAAEVAA